MTTGSEDHHRRSMAFLEQRLNVLKRANGQLESRLAGSEATVTTLLAREQKRARQLKNGVILASCQHRFWRLVARFFKWLTPYVPALKQMRWRAVIEHSGLFDADYYGSQNPDVVRAGMDPLDHYVQFGWREGRRPNSHLDLDQLLNKGAPALYLAIVASDQSDEHRWLVEARKDQARSLTVIADTSHRIRAEAFGLSDPIQVSQLDRLFGCWYDEKEAVTFLNAERDKTQKDANGALDLLVIVTLPSTLGCMAAILAALANESLALRVVAAQADNSSDLCIEKAREIGLPILTGDNDLSRYESKYVVLVDGHTIPLPECLKQLFVTMEDHPERGCAQPLVLNTRGLLSPGILPFHVDDPRHPDVCFLQDVGFARHPFVMMRRDLFDGFDGHLDHWERIEQPESDRCVLQPKAAAILFEPPVEASGRQMGGTNKRHILVVDACTPTPDQDSGSMDTVGWLRLLISWGLDVTFVPLNLTHEGRYTESLQSMGVRVLYVPYVSQIEDALAQELTCCDAVIVYRRPVAEIVMPIIRGLAPQIPVVFDTVDLHFLREQREATLSGSAAEREQAEKNKLIELDLMTQADVTIVLSAYERDLLQKEAPQIDVAHIPIGRPIPGRTGPGFTARSDVGFIGGFRHPPNVDAVTYFVNQIWPIVCQDPGFDGRFLVYGSHVPPEIRALKRERVIIRGYANHLDEVFHSCRVMVAPLRFGAGLKGKVISSLSYGVPVVASSMAVEGSALQHRRQVLIGDDPAEFARAVLEAYSDGDLWEHLSRASIAFCEEHFSERVVGERLSRLLTDLNILDANHTI